MKGRTGPWPGQGGGLLMRSPMAIGGRTCTHSTQEVGAGRGVGKPNTIRPKKSRWSGLHSQRRQISTKRFNRFPQQRRSHGGCIKEES